MIAPFAAIDSAQYHWLHPDLQNTQSRVCTLGAMVLVAIASEKLPRLDSLHDRGLRPSLGHGIVVSR